LSCNHRASHLALGGGLLIDGEPCGIVKRVSNRSSGSKA
jgi:hypothetical protein